MIRRCFVILAACALSVAWSSNADADADDRRITVNGDAEIRVVPDEVIVSLGVETKDPELAAAKSGNDLRTTAVLEAMKALGIPQEHIGTEYVSIEPEYRHRDNETQLMGYRARRTLVITLRELDKFEVLLSDALESGANYVHSVDFRTTELRKHRDQARALAIVAAREKAEALAAELGESIGRVQTINEGYARWWSWYGSGWGHSGRASMPQNVVQESGGFSAGAEAPTVPGQIAVHAGVSVTFRLDD